MSFTLVVVRPFGSYVLGDRIRDATMIARLLAGEHAANVVRVSTEGA